MARLSSVSMQHHSAQQRLTPVSDGSSPEQDGVSQTAVNEAFTTKKSNGALAMPTGKMAGAVMLFLLSGFTLLG